MNSFYATVKKAYFDEWQFLRSSAWDMALVSWIPLLIMALMVALFWQAVPRSLPIAVVDSSHSTISRDIIRKVDSTPAVSVVAQPLSLAEAWPLVETNQAHAVLYIPPQIDKDIATNQQATLFAFYNATMTTAGGTAVREIEAVVKKLNQEIAIQYNAFSLGPSVLKPAPIQAQVTLLYNPARNFEVFLIGLLLPGILHFVMCIAVTSAYALELRDKSVQKWIDRVGGHTGAALLGKALPYVLLFSLYGMLAILWIAYVRGDGIPGSLTALLVGSFLLYCAYAAFALLFAAVAPDMSSALSAVGLFAGTSLAFCGATFPIDGASLFARVWHHLIPFSTFVKLDVAERYINAPASLTLFYLLSMLLFVLVPSGLGYLAYKKAINNPQKWGRR